MIKELEKSIEEIFNTIEESDEFKRKFKAYIINSLNLSADINGLNAVLSSIEVKNET